MQVSIDGGNTFSDLEPSDGTTLSKRSLVLLQTPLISSVSPVLCDRNRLESTTEITVSGAHFSSQTLIGFYATSSSGTALTEDSFKLI